jgi:prephenate dehydrogenase
MTHPEQLLDCRVVVAGLGLMGGSLALGLQGKCAAVLGIDEDPTVVEAACRAGAVVQGSTRPEDLFPQADVIVLAVPVLEIIGLIHQLPDLHPGSPIVMDLGSTKRQILAAMESLPDRFDPIGGHPMCGKETNGFASAIPDLYHSAPFALVPLSRTSARAKTIAWELALALGACPLVLGAALHDQWTAETSHFPYLLSCTLAAVTSAEARQMVGPGFRSASRLAATAPQMMLDILQTNADNLLPQIERFREQLGKFEAMIQNCQWEDLRTSLEEASGQQKLLVGVRS